MKRISLILSLLTITSFCFSFTNIPGGNISSAQWNIAGSPYLINGDIVVTNSLNIDPGVEVIFQGHYGILVEGSMRAVGNATDRIVFKAQDTTNWHIDTIPQGGWKGIHYRLFSSSNNWVDSSQLAFCDIQDVKFGAASQSQNTYYNYTLNITNRNINILDCNIFHNQSATPNYSNGTIVQIYHDLLSTTSTEIARCKFYDNITWLGVVYVGQWTVPKNQTVYHVHHNKFYDNLGGAGAVFALHAEMLFEFNEVYNNTCDDRAAHSSGINLRAGKNIIRSNKFHHNLLHSNASISCNAGKATIEKNFIHNNYMSASGSLCGINGGGAGIHMAHNLNVPRDSTKFIVRDNIIANNQANFSGAGIHIVQADVEIYNNHILSNLSNSNGSAIAAAGMHFTDLKINNNIISNNGHQNWGNVWIACDTFTFDNNLIDTQYSTTVQIVGGVLIGDTINNIVGLNPNLINPTTTAGYLTDATNSDFHLMNNSPCIESGNANGFNLSATDFYGNSRIQGSSIDIGAHESESFEPNSVLDITKDRFEIYPNPITQGAYLQLNLRSLKNETLILRNIQGAVLKKFELKQGSNLINTDNIPRGVYLLSIRNGNKFYTNKLVIN